jgi:hypothetical protein
MVVNESDSIRISCEARGSPPLVITWQRGIGPNNIVRLSENTHIHSTSTDEPCNVNVLQNVIEINSSRAEDGVEYICQAQNDHPNVVPSKRLKITVQSRSINYYTSKICIIITTKLCAQLWMNVLRLHARMEECVLTNIWLSRVIVWEQTTLVISVKNHYIMVILFTVHIYLLPCMCTIIIL